MIFTQTGRARCVFIAMLCIFAVGCAAPRIHQKVLMPANADVMKYSKRVAVIDFHGDRDGIFTRKVESFFANINVQGAPYYSVIDPSMLDSILTDHFPVPQEVLSQAAELTEIADIGAVVSLFNKIASSAPGLGKIAPKIKAPKPRLPKPRLAKVDPSLPRISTPSYVFRQNDALRLGELSGADTILTGVVKWPYLSHKHSETTKDECVKYEKKSNPLTPGLKSNTCVRYVKKKIRCTTQTSKIDFVIKAVSVNDNQIAFTKDYSSSASHKYCNDDKNAKRKRPMELSEAAMDSAIRQMRHDVAPYVVTLTIQLLNKDDSDLKNNKAAKDIFDGALKFAKAGQLSRACEDFYKADEIYRDSPALNYNIGVCLEIKNDYEGALEAYRIAEDLLKKPNRTIAQAFRRVDSRIANDRKVHDQLR